MARIAKCTCISSFQDERYGEGNRVFNLAGNPVKGALSIKGYCTVCDSTVVFKRNPDKKEKAYASATPASS